MKQLQGSSCVLFALALTVAGCSSSTFTTADHGGEAGIAGGPTASNGGTSTATGGSVATTGGQSSAGGQTFGGTSSTGGATGSTASGGSPASGGSVNGGALGKGGTIGSGGAQPTGGTPATGGSNNRGGAAGSGTSGAAGSSTLGQTCGGMRGAQCDANQYCDYALGAICGAADAPGICKVMPQACAAIYAPVCGCDGKTYGNACSANAAGTSVASNGACT